MSFLQSLSSTLDSFLSDFSGTKTAPAATTPTTAPVTTPLNVTPAANAPLNSAPVTSSVVTTGVAQASGDLVGTIMGNLGMTAPSSTLNVTGGSAKGGNTTVINPPPANTFLPSGSQPGTMGATTPMVSWLKTNWLKVAGVAAIVIVLFYFLKRHGR